MARRFDDVTVKDGKRDATLQFTQRDFDPSRHSAQAVVMSRTLTVTAAIGDKRYERVVPDVDLEPGVKVKTEKKHIFATVKKTQEFNMRDKL